jgi:hypothetical protein
LGRLAFGTGIVKPETVIGRHRKGFRLFWTWKVRRGNPAVRRLLARSTI